METALALVIGPFFTVSIYLMLSKTIIRIILGVAILGNAINLLIFTCGRLIREVPPVIGENFMVPQLVTANPLPQALVLTAIVISFSFFTFLLVLGFRAYQELDTDETDEMRVAEPRHVPAPPQGY